MQGKSAATTVASHPRPIRAPSSTLPTLARKARRQAPWAALTALVAALVLLPVVPLQWQALKDGAAGLRSMWDSDGLKDVLVATGYLGVGSVVVAMVLGTSLALSMYALSARARRYLAFIPIIPLMVPSVAHVIGFVFLFSPENGYVNTALRATPFFSGDTGPINVYTQFWIIMWTGIQLTAFVYLFVYSGLQNLGSDHALAARVSGAKPVRVLFTVTLPMLRPVLTYASVVVFLLALGQFTAPLFLGRREGLDVLTTRMYYLTQDPPVDYGLAAAYGTPLIVAALILVAMQLKVIGNQSRFVGRGVSTIESPLTSWRTSALASGIIVLFGLIAALLPILALIYVSFSSFWSGRLTTAGLTLENFRQVFDDQVVIDSITTTMLVTLASVAIALPLGMLIAIALYNRERLWRPLATTLDVVVNLPLAVPGALIGFGFLFAYSSVGLGLYGSRTGLVVGFVTLMIPYSVRYQLATLISLGKQTTEASQVSGAGPLRTLVQVIMPLARNGIAASAAVVFIMLTHEFGVALLLRSSDTTVMSVVLFDRYGAGSYPETAVVALILTAITTVGAAVALAFGGNKAMETM